MEQHEMMEKLREHGVIPVIAIESPEAALPMADALIEGGLAVAEITFRTEAAAEVIKVLKKERPELLLGAGTILSVENMLKAQEYGAEFGVSPGLNPAIVKKAKETGFSFFPGVMTPSEIDEGLSFGIKLLKYFPSEASGGIKMLKAVSAPYAHLGVQFIPTGGINMSNLEEYLSLPQVLVVGGTWIAKKDVLSSGKWDQIRENAAKAVEVVKRIRG